MVTNYAEWKAAVAAEHKKLFEVSHYLNENGEERKRVFSTLTSLADFCETPEELLSWIESREGFHKCDVMAVESAHAILAIKALRRIAKKADEPTMRDEAEIHNLSKATQDDGTVCYFFGGTTIRVEESIDHGKLRLKPVAGDQVACGEWVDLDADQVAGYCALLEQHLNREGETA